MSTDILRSFLVELGWKIDEEGFRRFDHVMARAERSSLDLGVMFGATALAVEQGVEKMARQFEGLYFASQRTGATAAGLDAMNYAGRQVGLTAGQMQGAVEGFARAMRMQPGLPAYLQSLGVDVAGKKVDDIFGHFIGRMKEIPFPIAARIAAMFGLDSDTLLMLEKNYGAWQQMEDERRATMKRYGVDVDQATEHGRTFMVHLRELQSRFEALGMVIFEDFRPSAEWLIKWLDKGADEFAKIDRQTGNWLSTVVGIGAAAGGVSALAAMLTRLTGIPLGSGAFAALMRFTGWAGMLYTLFKVLEPTSTNVGEDAYIKAHPELYPVAPQGKMSHRAAPDSTQRAMEFFMRSGWSGAASAGIVANAARESSMNPEAVNNAAGPHKGLFQWSKARRDAILAGTGTDVFNASFDEQLAAAQWELTHTKKGVGSALRGVTSPEDAARIFSDQFEQPGDRLGEAQRRALGARNIYEQHQRSVTVHQDNKTDIHVHGVTDPHAAAREVLTGQERVQADALRNARGVVDVQ